MPAAYVIDRDAQLVVCRLWGVVEDRDVTGLTVSIAADGVFHPAMAQLLDLRSIARVTVTLQAIEAAAGVRDFGRGSRRAFVTGSTVVYGLARMYQSCREHPGEDLRIFQKLEDALDWLGLPVRARVLLDRLPGATQPA